MEVEGWSTFRGVDGSPPEGLTVPKEGVLSFDVKRSRSEGVLGVAMPMPLSLTKLVEGTFSEVVILESLLCSAVVGTVDMGSCLEMVNFEIGRCCCRAR